MPKKSRPEERVAIVIHQNEDDILLGNHTIQYVYCVIEEEECLNTYRYSLDNQQQF